MPEHVIRERPLGPQEALFAELIRRADGAIQMPCLAEFRDPPPAERLRQALARVHARHPMLQARIVDGAALHWRCDVPWRDIPLRCQAMGVDFDLETFYAVEADAPMDLARQAWRCVLLTDATGRVAWLALTFNHAAVDGRSALVVLNDLDRALTEPTAFGPDPLPLLPPVEQVLVRPDEKGDQGLELSVPAASMWPVAEQAPSSGRRPRAFLRSFPAARLERLHARLRSQGLHLAAAFCAAAVKAACPFPGHSGWTQVLAPTDIRQDCAPPIPNDAVGEFVSVISLAIGPDRQDCDLLELAAMLNEQLRARRPLALHLAPDYRLGETQAQADAIAAANAVFTGGLCVTDIGDLERLSGRPTGFSRVLLMPAQKHGIHPIMVAVVTTPEGACLSFGHAEPLTAAATAQSFAARYMAALDELAG